MCMCIYIYIYYISYIYIYTNTNHEMKNPVILQTHHLQIDRSAILSQRPQGLRSADPPPRGLLLDLGPGATTEGIPGRCEHRVGGKKCGKVYGMFMGFVWDFCGMFMGFLWDFYGISWDLI